MKVLVIGCGSMGRRHVATASGLGHDVAVLDPDRPTELACRRFDSPISAMRWRPEAVVIAVPARSHAGLIADWHDKCEILFVEKPLALSAADYFTPFIRSSSRPRNVAVGYQLRFNEHVRRLHRWARALPSPPKAAAAVCRTDIRTWPGADYADALLECSHELDVLAWLFGPTTCYGATASPTGQTWHLDLKCGEIPAKVELSTEATTYERGFVIQRPNGTIGAAWYWHAPADVAVLELDGTVERIAGFCEDVYAAELRAFLNGTWEGMGGCTLAEAIGTLDVCDRARVLAVAR